MSAPPMIAIRNSSRFQSRDSDPTVYFKIVSFTCFPGWSSMNGSIHPDLLDVLVVVDLFCVCASSSWRQRRAYSSLATLLTSPHSHFFREHSTMSHKSLGGCPHVSGSSNIRKSICIKLCVFSGKSVPLWSKLLSSHTFLAPLIKFDHDVIPMWLTISPY